MPADHLASLAGFRHLGVHLLIPHDHSQEIHHFTQANDPLPAHGFSHIFRINPGSRGFQTGSGGDTGWHLHPDMDRLDSSLSDH